MFVLIAIDACRYGERQRRDETAAHVVHPLPDAGAGEGVPLQPVPDQAAEDRDRARPVPDRAADKDMVPEQADEVEKGTQDGQHEHGAVPLSHGRPALRHPVPVHAPHHLRFVLLI